MSEENVKVAPFDLAALGICDQDQIAESAFARILLLGPAKGGKSCAAATAPKPLIINCDGASATKGAAKLGRTFLTVEASTRKSWKAAVSSACKAVEAGVARTVIVDTISLLVDNLLDEIKLTATGFDVWSALNDEVMLGVKRLLRLDAHVIINSHMGPDLDVAEGILPAIPGQLKRRIPAIIDDWVLLDIEPGRKPHERMLLVGAQKAWSHGCRNARRTCAIEASMPALFEELGITL